MAKDDRAPALIIIKRPRRGGHAHHGGAWKIAYADFVTAMMAFFLLLWLLASTTEEQRKGISDFFSAVPLSGEGSHGILKGTVLDVDGRKTASAPQSVNSLTVMSAPPSGQDRQNASFPPSAEALAAARREAETFEQIEDNVQRALERAPELANNLRMEMTADGLRIQLIDQERSPMFASGSRTLAPRMEELLRIVATMVAQVPNPIAIGGHTDSHPLARGDYTNWELSADRANAARRLLVTSGVGDQQVVRVLGLADREPLVRDDPRAASNRRISILVMKTTTN